VLWVGVKIVQGKGKDDWRLNRNRMGMNSRRSGNAEVRGKGMGRN